MFNRAELKNQAKEIIRKKYFVMVLVCLISAFLLTSILSMNLDIEQETAVLYFLGSFRFYVNYQKALMMAVPVVLIGALWSAFVIGPAKVGVFHYFKNASYDAEKFHDIWQGFQTNYPRNVKAMFVMELKVFLWTLLFVLPGIMKVYSYYFVPALLSDYPDEDMDVIFEMSEKMTRGIRWDIFVLNMSFFLWFLLVSVLTVFGLGFANIMLQPYINQTDAQLYRWAKENRLDKEGETEDVQSDLL